MGSKDIRAPSQVDILKWLMVACIVGVGIVGNVYFDTYSLAIRTSALILLAIIAGLIALTTHKGALLWSFFMDARIELRKVVWPTRQETVQMSMILVALVSLMSVVLWGIDSLFAYLINLVIM